MDPQILSLAALIVAVATGGAALYQQRRKGIPADLDTPDYWQQRANAMAGEMADLRERLRQMEQAREAMEASFQRQVATLLAELSETRAQLAETRFELSSAMDELDRLRIRFPAVMAAPTKPPARRLRVLAIWPDHDANPLSLETEAIDHSGIQYTPLIGEVTRRSILRELRRASPQTRYNVIHIGSHGAALDVDANSAGGLLLSGGDLATPSWWGQIASAYEIRLAVIMACTGDDVADAMRREGVAAVVSASAALADTAALGFSFALYENMAEGLPLAQAVEQATWTLESSQAKLIRLHGTDPWEGGNNAN